MKLFKTLEDNLIHVHDGSGHYLCGMADDMVASETVKRHLVTCPECIGELKKWKQIAKDLGI